MDPLALFLYNKWRKENRTAREAEPEQIAQAFDDAADDNRVHNETLREVEKPKPVAKPKPQPVSRSKPLYSPKPKPMTESEFEQRLAALDAKYGVRLSTEKLQTPTPEQTQEDAYNTKLSEIDARFGTRLATLTDREQKYQDALTEIDRKYGIGR